LIYHQGNLIARLAPIKEDPYEKRIGPGSYDPVKPQMKIVPGVSSWGKSNQKRSLWFEEQEKLRNKDSTTNLHSDGNAGGA
jgi:hypothetical protein